VKAETESIDIARFGRDHGARFRILTGNWGAEYPYFREDGAHGLIPAPNFVPEQAAIHHATDPRTPNFARAIKLYARIFPLMQFIRERPGVEEQLLLGKHMLAQRLNLASCLGRLPGPQIVDASLLSHAERLASAVWPRDTVTG